MAEELGWSADDLEPPPECPPELSHVMVWYFEIARGRGAGLSGPSAIEFSEIESWARLTGRSPDVFEVRCLHTIDGVFRASAARAAESRRRVNK